MALMDKIRAELGRLREEVERMDCVDDEPDDESPAHDSRRGRSDVSAEAPGRSLPLLLDRKSVV